MERREAIQLVAVLLGGTVIGAEAFLTGCNTTPKKVGLFSDDDLVLFDQVGETILPTTPDSPGAKAAGIGQFMKVYVTDCYTPADQQVFTDGLVAIDQASRQKYGKPFTGLTAEQQVELLTPIDQEARAAHAAKKDKTIEKKEGSDSHEHYFYLMKQLTILGYFTSEVGAKQDLRYVPVPGHYDGNYPYKKGDKAWALS